VIRRPPHIRMPHAPFPKNDAPRELFARILSDGGPTHVGIVRDQVALERSTRALVEFPREDAPFLAVGSRVWVDFAGGSDRADSMAKVVFRGESEEFRRYEFTFGPNEAVQDLLERRQTERIRPGAGARVQFRGRGSYQRHEGRVADLSTAGIALGAELESEEALLEVDEVELALYLDPDGVPVLVMGQLVWRRLVGTEVHYGIEFQASRTPGFGSAQERIDRYVRAQREEPGVHRRAS